MVNVTLVISRYNEDISWSQRFPNKIVYNKGHNNIPEYNPINIPNVGREGHTYYTYIYDNYDTLDDYTIFLQGHPFDHSPHIIEDINRIITLDKIEDDFNILSKYYTFINLAGEDTTFGKHYLTKDVFQKLFNCEIIERSFEFGHGAQFMVKKETILKRPREFYMKIIKLLEYASDPIEAHCIERLHKPIFTWHDL